MAILRCRRDPARRPPDRAQGRGTRSSGALSIAALLLTTLLTFLPGFPGAKDFEPSFEIARAEPGAKIALYESPGGRVITTLRGETEFGSDRTFYVAEDRGEWLGVTSAAAEDNELVWMKNDPEQIALSRTLYSLRADLSERMVEIHYGDELVETIPVSVGRAGSETPEGVFSVTDGLAGKSLGPYYGCCVLALSGHQPTPPPGWIGGNRIAIHGTPGPVGGAASAGCLRASDRDMVDLFKLVPLGTPVFVSN